MNKEIMNVRVDSIFPNTYQPRKFFNEEALNELSQSIKEHGIIQPITVRKIGEKFELVAGERRWRAAKLAGLKEVPAIIMELTDKDVLEISLIENIQRQDLNPIEEALAYRKLISEFKITQEELSKRIGKSRVAIANTIRLTNLDNRVQQYLIDGIITEGHGRALLAVSNEELQYELAQQVIDDKLSVRELERIIKRISEEKKNENNNKLELNPYYKELKNQLQNYFGTKVNISNKKNRGKIEIEYYSEDDLQRILDIINI